MNNIVVNMIAFENRIKLGVSQSSLFEEISLLGIKKIEIRREYIKDVEEFKKMKELKKILNLEYYYSVPDILFDNNGIRLNELERYLIEANSFGCKRIKLTAGYTDYIDDADVEILNNKMKAYSIKLLTIENDQNKNISTSRQILSLLELCKDKNMNIKYTYDPTNYEYINEYSFINYKRFVEFIAFVHIKDIDLFDYKIMPLFKGNIPWEKYLKKMKKDLPKTIDYCIEYPCEDSKGIKLSEEINKILEEKIGWI